MLQHNKDNPNLGTTESGFYYERRMYRDKEQMIYWKVISGHPGKLAKAAGRVEGCTYLRGKWLGRGSSRQSTIQFASPDVELYNNLMLAYKDVCKEARAKQKKGGE